MRWLRRSSATEDPEGPPPPVFFVHVMKAGGTTLVRHLREHYASDEIYPPRAVDARSDDARVDATDHLRQLSMTALAALPPERRRRIRLYAGHFPYVGQEVLGGGFTTMTILRDPVERTISLLRQRVREISWMADPNRPAAPVQSTLEQTYARPFVFDLLIHNHQTKLFSMQQSDAPDTYMDMIDVDGDRLALAKANLAEVNVVGITEDYGDFLDEVDARFGWAVPRDSRANATPASAIQPVSASLRSQIARDNAIDIEFHAYARDLVQLRRARRTIV